jgi:hypothetical protein
MDFKLHSASKGPIISYNSTALFGPRIQDGLFALHSQLLGESLLVSFPPRNDMLKFQG